MCNKIVDVIYETFTHKYYFIKIFHLKKVHVYLFVRKKRQRLLGEEKNAFHKKISNVLQSIFNWPGKSTNFWVKNTFLIQNCIIFYFLVINILTNIIDEIYLCPHTFLALSSAFLNIPKKDTSNFSFNYEFDGVLY